MHLIQLNVYQMQNHILFHIFHHLIFLSLYQNPLHLDNKVDNVDVLHFPNQMLLKIHLQILILLIILIFYDIHELLIFDVYYYHDLIVVYVVLVVYDFFYDVAVLL